MKWPNSSNAALAMSAAALFVALGGTAVAVSGQIGTNQLKNGAVTNAKLKNGAVGNHKIKNAAVGNHKIANGAVGNQKLANNSVSTAKLQDGAVTLPKLAAGVLSGANLTPGSVTSTALADNAVTTAKLANGAVTNPKLGADAVTGDKVKDGSLTSADIAPNTFVAGVGRLASGRVVVAPGSVQQVLDLGFGRIVGNCSPPPGNTPTLGFTAFVNGTNIVDTFTNFTGTTDVVTTNALPAGGTLNQPNTPGGPQSVTWQIAYNDGVQNHVATVETSGQFQFGIGCVFIGQGTTTG